MTITTPVLLVCIDAHPKSGMLLRRAARNARELGMPWHVLYVETPRHAHLSREAQRRMLRFFTIAEEMGGRVHQATRRNVLAAIVEFIQEAQDGPRPVRKVIVGQARTEGWLASWRSSLAEQLMRRLKNRCEVQAIPLGGKAYSSNWFGRFRRWGFSFRSLLWAVGSVGLAYAGAEGLRMVLGQGEFRVNAPNVMAIFLIACCISALRGGFIAGLLSAVISFNVLNYFYIPPLHSFGIFYSNASIALAIFLLSSVLISLMAAHSRASQQALQRRERRTQALFQLHRITSQASNRKEALQLIHSEISGLLEMKLAFFLPETLRPDSLRQAWPESAEPLSAKDREALDWCWRNVQTTGVGTVRRPATRWRFEPMVTPEGEVGVMAVCIPKRMAVDAGLGRLLGALADQAAVILKRIELNVQMGEIRVREEREKLRSMLLSSVSHDLKTPLSSIIGSLGVFRSMQASGRLTGELAEELIDTALDEGHRLNSFISNILEMTRIESGDVQFEMQWHAPEEAVWRVKKRLHQRLRHHQLVIAMPDSALEVRMDRMMMEQVLQNVLDNAAKYAPAGTRIEVRGEAREGGGFAYHIRDHGQGIPEDKWQTVFDKYERLRMADSQIAGTGLGLAICKAVMEKQGGGITLRNHPEGGAEFSIWLPESRPRPLNFGLFEQGELLTNVSGKALAESV